MGDGGEKLERWVGERAREVERKDRKRWRESKRDGDGEKKEMEIKGKTGLRNRDETRRKATDGDKRRESKWMEREMKRKSGADEESDTHIIIHKSIIHYTEVEN